MSHHTTVRPDLDEPGPSPSDLAAIEAEWPLIAAELDVLDAEIRLAMAGPYGPTELDWARLRAAQRRALRTAVRLANTTHTRTRRVPAARKAA